jgi:hypothetical protein
MLTSQVLRPIILCSWLFAMSSVASLSAYPMRQQKAKTAHWNAGSPGRCVDSPETLVVKKSSNMIPTQIVYAPAQWSPTDSWLKQKRKEISAMVRVLVESDVICGHIGRRRTFSFILEGEATHDSPVSEI